MTENPSPKTGTSKALPVVLITVVAVIAMVAGIWFGQPKEKSNRLVDVGPGAVLMPQSRPLVDFNLIGQNGKPFTKETIRGKWYFVFFGYTYCPDVCPVALNNFREVKAIMKQKGDSLEDVGFLFVSVDPERDTPERLGSYVEYFDPGFMGATGSESELQMLTRQMGVVYRKVEGKSKDDYLVDHSAGVFLLNPDVNLQAYFTAPHDPLKVVQAFRKIREYED